MIFSFFRIFLYFLLSLSFNKIKGVEIIVRSRFPILLMGEKKNRYEDNNEKGYQTFYHFLTILTTQIAFTTERARSCDPLS